MNRKFILVIVSFFILLSIEAEAIIHNTLDKDHAICVDTLKKYPYMPFYESLKNKTDFFIAVITYNSKWGMFPSYVYLREPIELKNSKANIIIINDTKYNEISKLIDKYIRYDKDLFVKHGQSAFPAIFHLVIVYNKGKTSKILLSQLSNKITDKYENNMYKDNPFSFLSKLANLTNTDSMFESIYGFSSILAEWYRLSNVIRREIITNSILQ